MTSLQATIASTVALALGALLVLTTPAEALPVPGRPDCAAVAAAVRGEIDGACPCDAADRHSSYVRCVAAKLRQLAACTVSADGTRECGPVPRRCVGKLRRLAARSACGERGSITCCVPRQHDCVGDPAPGDGTAAGTCRRSTKPCDRVEDCLIPKCQAAPSIARCEQVGGTPGVGRNCRTACGTNAVQP